MPDMGHSIQLSEHFLCLLDIGRYKINENKFQGYFYSISHLAKNVYSRRPTSRTSV